MKHLWLLVAFCATLVLGCGNKEDELQKQLAQVQIEKTAIQRSVSEKDKYVDDVMQAVNEVYADLESARAKEGKLTKNTGNVEWSGQANAVDAREKVLKDINDIGTVLKENRKKISDLAARVKASHKQIASLSTLIENLKTSLHEREQSIAQLEARVQGLETTVAEKTKTVQEKEAQIDEQQRTLNTTYYVVGTRDELKKKGIISDEGGFLWGLLGSTTIMASGIDQSQFNHLDKTKDQAIHVQGKIEEILPRRNPDYFATDESGSALTIVSPDRFWQDKYLVIVVD